MNKIDGIPELRAAISTFSRLYGQHLPADLGEAFDKTSSEMSAVVAICQTAEVLYAKRAEITDTDAAAAARTLAGQLAVFAAQNGWHGMADENRGVGICWAMQRELGETAPPGTAWPAADSDPAPHPLPGETASTPDPAPEKAQ